MSRQSMLIAALLSSFLVENPTITDEAAKELHLDVPKPPRERTKTGKRERERRLRQLAKRGA